MIDPDDWQFRNGNGRRKMFVSIVGRNWVILGFVLGVWVFSFVYCFQDLYTMHCACIQCNVISKKCLLSIIFLFYSLSISDTSE